MKKTEPRGSRNPERKRAVPLTGLNPIMSSNLSAVKRPWSFPRTVIALGLVSLFNDASSEIISPLLPLFLTSTLGVSYQFIGLIEGITESASSLLKYPAGWISDRFGKRKPLVIFGYGLASLVRPVLSVTTAGWQVLGLRFIDRLGKGVRTAPRDALIADSVSAERRGQAYGFHRAMDHAGAIAGSLAAAVLVGVFSGDYRKVFLVAAIPALIGLIIIIFAVRDRQESVPEVTRTTQPEPETGFSGNFKSYLWVLLLFTLGNSSDAFLLLRAQNAGFRPAMIPILWAALHLSKSISSIAGGGLSDRWGRRRLIIGGWLVYAAIYLGFAYAGSSAEIWGLFIFYGIYFGLTEGVEKAMVADLVKPRQRGSAFGLYNLVIGIGSLPASLMTGIIWQRWGARAALTMGAVISLVSVILLIFYIKEGDRDSVTS